MEEMKEAGDRLGPHVRAVLERALDAVEEVRNRRGLGHEDDQAKAARRDSLALMEAGAVDIRDLAIFELCGMVAALAEEVRRLQDEVAGPEGL